MDSAPKFVCSALIKLHTNQSTMAQTQSSNASNTLAVVLGTNQIVERCFAKMANDVTSQVRDKLIDIILAVIARECEDFDVELLRRLINAEIPDHTITIEKRVKTQDPESKTKTKTPKSKIVELDAEGNPIKQARKEKAPKAPKEPKAPKAILTEEEKAALKAEKDAAKAVAKEAAKAAKQLEREAAKAAKALADAEKPAKPAKEPKAPKEVRLPIPWCGVAIADRCQALRSYHGLFAQCTADKPESGNNFCASCEKASAPFGTVAMRAACGVFDYVAPNGKKCVRLANVIEKFGHKTEQFFQEEADKLNITIPYEHLEKEVKQRGRPKSLSPRATTTKGKGKVATTDTTPASSRNASDADDNSETETENDEPVTAAAAAPKAPKATGEKKQKQQQARKKVEKTAEAAAAAAADTEAPAKKRGRPAKAKEPAVEVNESLIQDLVSSASGRAEQELSEENITPIPSPTPAKKAVAVVAAPAAPKKAPSALKKKTARVTEVVNGMTMWVEAYEGSKIWVNPQNLAVYDASNGEGVGLWDDVAKTIKFEEDDDEIAQFSDEE